MQISVGDQLVSQWRRRIVSAVHLDRLERRTIAQLFQSAMQQARPLPLFEL